MDSQLKPKKPKEGIEKEKLRKHKPKMVSK